MTILTKEQTKKVIETIRDVNESVKGVEWLYYGEDRYELTDKVKSIFN